MEVHRIVLIDDNSIFCFIFQKLVEKYNNGRVEVIVFDNGKSALDYFLENANEPNLLPKLIFVDINMPILSGWEFLDALVSCNHMILTMSPFFIVSSSDNDIDINKSNEYPFIKGYFNKPLDKGKLFSVLDGYLK